jgi:hypothetical protein
MIPQIEQLQRILNKILPERYSEIKNINVFEHEIAENPGVYVLIATEHGDNEELIKSEVNKIAKLVSVPLSNVLVLPEFMIYKN